METRWNMLMNHRILGVPYEPWPHVSHSRSFCRIRGIHIKVLADVHRNIIAIWNHTVLTSMEQRARLWRLLGNFAPSILRLYVKFGDIVKLCMLLGRITSSRLWLKQRPNVKHCRLSGKATFSRLWLKPSPNVKLCRLFGKVTCSRLWLKPLPDVKLCRLFGKCTCSRLWSKQ